jgi:signal peptidase I
MIKDGMVYINGEILNESEYLSSDIITTTFEGSAISEGEELSIPENAYFVMGDNRIRSTDSRVFGVISGNDIRSKISFCYSRCK